MIPVSGKLVVLERSQIIFQRTGMQLFQQRKRPFVQPDRALFALSAHGKHLAMIFSFSGFSCSA
jgi:hypothetical protein